MADIEAVGISRRRVRYRRAGASHAFRHRSSTSLVMRSSGGDNGDANSTAIDFRWVANGDFGHNYADIRGSSFGTIINMVAPQHAEAYGQGRVHDNTFNLINAGSEGNVDTSGLPSTDGQSGVPRFASYVPYAVDNDFHLTADDSVARDKGTSLVTFTTDKDGVARPQGARWDIGAYEAGAMVPSLKAPQNVRITGVPSS